MILDLHRGMNFVFWFWSFCTVCEANLLPTFRKPLWVPASLVWPVKMAVTKYLKLRINPFLGAFAKLRNWLLTALCPSVRMEQLGSYWTDFYEIWYLSMFRKSVPKILVLLKSDKNYGCFARRHVRLCYLAEFFLELEMFRTEIAENIKIRFTFSNFFRKSYRLWDNGGPR